MRQEYRVEKVQAETAQTFTYDVRDRADVFVASFATKAEAQRFAKAENKKAGY